MLRFCKLMAAKNLWKTYFPITVPAVTRAAATCEATVLSS
jgi:hypothetical protein